MGETNRCNYIDLFTIFIIFVWVWLNFFQGFHPEFHRQECAWVVPEVQWIVSRGLRLTTIGLVAVAVAAAVPERQAEAVSEIIVAVSADPLPDLVATTARENRREEEATGGTPGDKIIGKLSHNFSKNVWH